MLICPLICIALKTHFKLVLLPDFEHRTVQHDVLVTLRYYIIIVIPLHYYITFYTHSGLSGDLPASVQHNTQVLSLVLPN